MRFTVYYRFDHLNHRQMSPNFTRQSPPQGTVSPPCATANRSAQPAVACIIRFTQFIEWPQLSTTTDNAFTICILNAHVIEDAFHEIPAQLKVQNRKLKIQRVSNPHAAVKYQILFIPPEQANRIGAVHRLLNNKPVLIVSDTPGLAKRGSIINFVNLNNRLRFEVNPGIAQSAGLSISSRLLKLAIVAP